MKDRRKKQRFPIGLPVLIKPKDGRIFVQGVTIDLSVSGFSFSVPVPFSPGEHLECFIQLPEGAESTPKRYISCTAEIVRIRFQSDGYTIGCVAQHQTIVDETQLPDWARIRRMPAAAAGR